MNTNSKQLIKLVWKLLKFRLKHAFKCYDKSSFFNEINYWTWSVIRKQVWYRGYINPEKSPQAIVKDKKWSNSKFAVKSAAEIPAVQWRTGTHTKTTLIQPCTHIKSPQWEVWEVSILKTLKTQLWIRKKQRADRLIVLYIVPIVLCELPTRQLTSCTVAYVEASNTRNTMAAAP